MQNGKADRPQTSTPALTRKTKEIQPEYNQPISHIKPLIIKGVENVYLDANKLAEIESRKLQMEKEQQRSRQERMGESIRMNASKLMSEQSRRMNDSRRIKEEMVIKHNQLKEKYTIVKQEKPKKITQQPTAPKVAWKSALSPSHASLNPQSTPKIQNQSNTALATGARQNRKKSKSPSMIAHPKYQDAALESDESVSEIDSDVEQREQSLIDVISKFEKIRTILRSRKC